ncbi:MAG: DUF4011 domain-containing protein [Candidatus Phytoplasma sp.]|nr:DUF4011 domain-containing protein [Phytoplasma sp.]
MQKQIEYLSKKTLDLSLRNPQINFKRERLTNIHIQNDMQYFYDHLVKNEKGINIGQGKETLLTNFSINELQSKMEYLYTKQRQIINEYGFHPLYAVFGLLKWTDLSTRKEVYSPLLMVPVEIMKKGRKTLNLSHNGDQIVLNPTLVHRLSIDQVDLTVYDLLEHQAFDIHHYLNTIKQTLEKYETFEVIEESYLGFFSSTHLYIYKDLEENKNKIENHKIIQKLYQKDEGILPDKKIKAEDIDSIWKEEDNYQIYTADGSQETAILASRTDSSFVLQGPPGTGKSQTITNIIAQAIAENKKVLFVAEKKAALEVVSQKLKSKGLDIFTLDLHHYQVKKDHLINQLVAALKEHENFKYKEEMLHTDLANVKTKLLTEFENTYHKNEVINHSLYEIYGQLLKYLEMPVINYKIEKIYEKTARELLKDIETLKEYHLVKKDNKQIPKELKNLKINEKIPKEIIENTLYQAEKVQNFLMQINTENNKKLQTYQELMEYKNKVKHYAKMPMKLIYQTQKDYQLALQENKKLLSQLNELRKIHPNILNLDYQETLKILNSKSFLGIYSKEYKELSKNLNKWLNKGNLKQNELISIIENYEPFFKLKELELKKEDILLENENIEWILSSPFRLTKKEITYWQKLDKKQIKQLLEQTQENLVAYEYYLKQINEIFIDQKIETLEDRELKQLKQLIHVYSEIKGSRIYHQKEKQIKDKKLEPLYQELKKYSVEQWNDLILKRYYLEWLSYLEFKNPSQYTPDLLKMDIEKFIALEKSKLDKNSERIKKNVFKKYPSENSPEIKMILAESLKTKGQKSARQIIDLMPHVLLDMKPCFLMSPTTVSAFLPQIENMFDLIIFDEASQVVPEHAIGSIYRGKKLIVCGDHEQLPPTQFFSQIMEIDEEDFEEISDYESILDIARTSLTTYQLNWHYRSKYSELIYYSNQKIYKTLIAASEPKKTSKGIYYHYLKEGFYEQQINKKEAEFIAQKVIEHAQKFPEKSLGIIAFSKKQEKQIEDQIKKIRRHHPELEDFFDEEKEEYFFVKNLENVQGDERDVIYLSICYGKTKDGKMSYRFGPINQQVGYRRLNVAITRAKEQMNIVSSILPEDINDPNKNEGIAFLKNYLDFSLKDNQTKYETKQPHNDVLLDIYQTLKNLNYSVEYNENLFDSLTLEDDDKAICLYVDSIGYEKLPTLKDRNILAPNLILQKGWDIYPINGLLWYQNKPQELMKLKTYLEENNIAIKEEKIETKIEEQIYEYKTIEQKEESQEEIDLEIPEKIELKKPQIREILNESQHRLTVEQLERTEDETLVEYIKRFILEIIKQEEGITETDLYERIAPLYQTKKLSIHEKNRIQQWLIMWHDKKYLTYFNGVITK